MVGFGGNGAIIAKREYSAIAFDFPAEKRSFFHATFKTGDRSVNGFECYIPLVVEDELLEFIFSVNVRSGNKELGQAIARR
jgi:hypothetical protein